MRDPYKIIVAGTGGIGKAVLLELLRRPEFEIVGVMGFSKRKDGRDVGELIGQDAGGLKVANDQQAMIDLKADCVVWCGYFPMPHLEESTNALVIKFLESGKNVISPTCFHYPPAHGDAYVKQFEDACKKGKSSLHGGGENPGFWLERVAMTLSGLCNEVEYMKVDEYCNLALTTGSEKMWNAAGYGLPEAEAKKLTAFHATWEKYYFHETLNLASMSIYGKMLDQFKMSSTYFTTDEAFALSEANGDPFDMAFPKGSVKGATHRFDGYIDGKLKLTATASGYLSAKHSPFPDKKDSSWDIEIEGKPTSVQCTVAVQASFRDKLVFTPGDTTSPLYYATAVPIIQSIPVVCGHEPGIVYPSVFASCAPDLRLLEKRKSLVG